MENRKLVKFVVPALLLGLFVNSPHVLAYGVETHAALTTNIFDFYNQSFPDKKLPEELKNFLIDGSRHEDSAPRWMNHFYDPVKDRGLESVYGDGYKSKEWAASKDKQNEARYKIATALASLLTIVEQKKISAFTTETDFTWERAIRFWVNGDKEKAMYILGHILHLIEDASVPDHTRNDAHPGFAEDKSPYENFTQNPEIYNKDASTKLKGKSSVKLATLAEYFEGIAKYSNNNFFSKNTIRRGYEKPGVDLIETEKDGKYIYAFLRDSDGVRFRGVAYLNPNAAQRSWALDPELSLEDGQGYLVLGDYWNLLSVKSIQHGAGVIDLFFKEVEKAKNDPNFVREEKTMLGQIVGAVSGLYDKTKTLLADTWQRATGTSAPNAIEIPLGENAAAPTSEQEAASASQLATTDSANTAPQGTVPAKQNTTPSTSSAPTTTTQNIAPSQSPTLRTAAPSTPQDQKVVTAPKTAETSQTATAPTPKQCSFTQGGSPSHQSAILNEIAWMGTVTSANDEWMELKNISSAILDISGWQLLDQGEQIKVVFLPGTKILAGGYLLLERTNDFSVPNIAADLIYSGALSNTSEGLRLFNSQCALIDEVLASPDWPAGNAADRLTMERDLSGFSWHNTTRYGGTPRRENSAPAPAVPTGGSGGSSSAPATTAPASNADNSSTNTVSTSTPELPSPPTSTSTPPTSSTVPAAMHVVISEILTGRAASSTDEFVELYNPTDQAVPLDGWSLKRKATPTSTAGNLVSNGSGNFNGKTIAPKGFLLIASNQYAGGITPDVFYSQNSNFLVE
ncbi:MAG: lamin tail domain-containing protein, partial [bacterium]|nr:lamin tail domain-containing protein [bacterium]